MQTNSTQGPTVPFPTFPGKSRTPQTVNNMYLACLVDPDHFPMRLPDEYATNTALYSSKIFYDVYGNFNAGSSPSDWGKFSFFIRPSLGMISGGPAHTYLNSKVVNPNPSVLWPPVVAPNNYELNQDPNLDALLGTATTHQMDGLVRSVRPVAMSAWFKWTAPSLNMGGQVAMALMDGEGVDYHGQALYNYKNLSILPDSYEGSIVNGCYGFWRPFDNDDSVFQTGMTNYSLAGYDFGATYKYPALVISGQLSYQGVGPFAGPIGRLEISTIHEYVTHSRVVATEPSPVNPAMIIEAKQLLWGVPSCMSNDLHSGFFGSLLNIGRKYILPNLGKLGIGVGTALGGPALGLVLGGVGRGIGTAGQMLARRNDRRRADDKRQQERKQQQRERDYARTPVAKALSREAKARYAKRFNVRKGR